MNTIELVRAIRDNGGYNVSYIKGCYREDKRNRAVRHRSFDSYFASIIMDDYPVSRYVAMYVVKHYCLDAKYIR